MRGARANGRHHFGKNETEMMNQDYCHSVQFPAPANHSLIRQRNSLFPQEQGIGYKWLNPLGDGLPKPPQEAGIGRDFQTFPANFPAVREFAA